MYLGWLLFSKLIKLFRYLSKKKKKDYMDLCVDLDCEGAVQCVWNSVVKSALSHT